MMIMRSLALIVIVSIAALGITRAQSTNETGDQVKVQAEAAVAKHDLQTAYALYLRAQSDYISEGNQTAADEMGKAADKIKKSWETPSSAGAIEGKKNALWTAFNVRSGRPNGTYACSAMLERFVGMSPGEGGMPVRVPQIMLLSPITFTAGTYVLGWSHEKGAWSGGGDSLHLSGKTFRTATAQYGVNGRGRSTVRVVFPVANANPVVWMCSR